MNTVLCNPRRTVFQLGHVLPLPEGHPRDALGSCTETNAKQ